MFVSGVVVKKRIGVEEIVKHILSKCPDLTREEIVLTMEKKKVAGGGFLIEVATARLVAAEYGVEIKFEMPLPKIYIHQLVPGLNDVTISGRVLLVNKPQVFS